MIDPNISNKLKGLEFDNYSNVLRRILESFGILDTTIKRILNKIENGDTGPFHVYRRAIIYLGENDEEKVSSSLGSCSLVLNLKQNGIAIYRKNDTTICKYCELCKNLDKLSALYDSDINKQDPYSTLQFDSLVESLYRSLKLLENDENNIRGFIFSLMYIAHFSSLIDKNKINIILGSYQDNDDAKLFKIFKCYETIGRSYGIENTTLNKLVFSKEAYKYIFGILRFDTTAIDSEILSSLIYRMVDKDSAGLYGHQTSYENVHKLTDSLFINDLEEKIKNSTISNIYAIVTDIFNIEIFDPTNGPGCYLASSYNSLCQLIGEIERKFSIKINESLNLGNFVSICSNELTKSLTMLALIFSHTKELKRRNKLSLDIIKELPTKLCIRKGNELECNWEDFVKPSKYLFIIGSPKFKGRNKLSQSEKEEMFSVYGCSTLFGADYCSAWLVKAADFISNSEAKAAFVLTNSVSQGEQSSFIYDNIKKRGCEYIFAFRSFKWKVSNDNTGVTVVVIGIATSNSSYNKFVVDGQQTIQCNSIGASLLPDIDIQIKSRSNPLCSILPKMRKGNMPDGAAKYLTFSSRQLDSFLKKYPKAEKFIKPLYGGDEFVNSNPRWVLWITDEELNEAKEIPGIAERIEQVREYRETSTSSEKSKANPHKFRETNCTDKGKISVIVPCVTSENREYFQMGILDSSAIVNNNVNVIFNCDIWILALLESRMHLVWAKYAAGGQEVRPRYSSQRCYNTFPAPNLNKEKIGILHELAKLLLEVRENYCDKSLAQLYDKMPPELKRVHALIDKTVDSFYQKQGFQSDESRLLFLERMYYDLTKDE